MNCNFPSQGEDYPNVVTDALYQHEESVIALKRAAQLLDGASDEFIFEDGMETREPADPSVAAVHAILSSQAGLMGALQCWELDNRQVAAGALREELSLQCDTEAMRQWHTCLGSSIDQHLASSLMFKALTNGSDSREMNADAFFEEFPDCAQSPESQQDEVDDSSSSEEDEEDEVLDVTEQHKQKHSRVTKESSLPMTNKKNPYSKSEKDHAHFRANSRVPQQPIPHETAVVPQRPSSSYSRGSENFSYTPSTPSGQTPVQQPGPSQYLPPPSSQTAPQKQPQWQNSTQSTIRNPYGNRAQWQHNIGPPKDSLPTYGSSWDDHLEQQNPFQSAAEVARAEKKQGHQCVGTRHHQQQQNPFQSAAEVARLETKKANNQNYRQQYQQPQQQRRWHPAQPGENPYYRNRHLDDGDDEDKDPVLERKSNVPESLRRPYRNPCQPRQQKRATSDSSKRTLGGKPMHQIRKNATTSNNGVGATQSKPKSDASDNDEDLPKELQRFGKELVEKIESEIIDNGEPVTFDEITGLADAKQTITEVIIWPMKHPEIFTGLRRAPRALLLFGPPGTGKTLIGKAIAHESKATFFSISSSSLTSKWIGEGEKLVRTMFAVATYRAPSCVFIDEIDSLLTKRKDNDNEASRRIKTEFLVQMDGAGTQNNAQVLTIGATNRPHEIDEAARRRFTKRLLVPLPDEPARLALMKVLLVNDKHELTHDDLAQLSRETKGYSGADISSLCKDASMGPIREISLDSINLKDIPPISYKHFRASLRDIKPSVAPAELVQYEEWDKIYGSKRPSKAATDGDDSQKGDNSDRKQKD